MTSNHNLPASLKEQLDKIDPTGEYSGRLPKILSTSNRVYYVKTGTVSDEEQWVGEAESLKDMERAAPGLAPRLYAFGKLDNGKPFFISEYKDIGPLSTSAAVTLAKRLATELHQLKSTNGFGYQVPTYCGPTRFPNGWYESWNKCYAAMYGTLIEKIREREKYGRLCSKGDIIIQSVIPKLLGKLVIQPVLCHGDLWSGNAGVDQATGEPVIFDAASYYGHNESDLAIARIFGGFPRAFFETYFQSHPKSDPEGEYPLRADLYESFHYLNHTVIFGGGYAAQAESKMDAVIEADRAGKTQHHVKQMSLRRSLRTGPVRCSKVI